MEIAQFAISQRAFRSVRLVYQVRRLREYNYHEELQGECGRQYQMIRVGSGHRS